MPTELSEAKTGSSSLVFAADAQGIVFRLTEAAVYGAEEVREEIGQGDDGTPEYGRWLRAEIEEEEAWINAPGEVIQELQRLDAEAGEIFTVTRCQKAGNGETDPWEVNMERLSDDDQTRF